MGVVASKGDNNTPLLNLCKERKELMRAARDARYHLAKAHLFYFRSLLDFSNTLNQFVQKDLIVIPYSSDDDSSSSDLICSGSDLGSGSNSDSDSLVCDRSKTGPLSNNGGNRVKQGFYPEIVPGDDRTCGSSNNVHQGMKMSKQSLGFVETVFMTPPVEESLMKGSENFPGRDLLGLYDYEDNTQSFFIEPDQRAEVESDDDQWREIREREGIPDLETESDHVSLIRKNQKKKNVEESSSVADEIDNSHIEVIPRNSEVEGEDHNTPEIVSEEVSDDSFSSSYSSFSESSGSNLTDLRNVVKKINGICEKAVSYSEVSELLEVSKVVHHQPLGDQFMGFASRVLCTSRDSTRSLLLKRSLREENLIGSLSVTLDKLYMWEKKLYAEVTVEEKLRLSYDKAYKILKNLDQTGAESSKIYEAQTMVKFHLSKIDVSVRAVETISMRIHKIRDEELLFQVIEIINGFREMWRFLAKCHHKQFRAIAKSNSCIHIVEPDSVVGKGSSSRNATHKVEERIRRYRESLRSYIDAQRGFVKLLNEWLTRSIMEDDETAVEAPEIFRLCNDWLREIEKVEEIKVLSAVEEMRLRFQGLGFKQLEEEKQRMRTERLSKEIERKTKEVEEIWGNSVSFQASDSTAKMMMGPELMSLRESLAQEKEKHEKVMIELNDAVSVSLQESLVPVFEALEDFCLANLRAYKNTRIVSRGAL